MERGVSKTKVLWRFGSEFMVRRLPRLSDPAKVIEDLDSLHFKHSSRR